MFTIQLIITLLFSLPTICASSKRGLVGVTTPTSGVDISSFLQSSQLSWAYNYGTSPQSSTFFGSLPFVPQLWGTSGASSFVSAVSTEKLSQKYVLAFNEPDGVGSGQANMSPALAAQLWMSDIQPLKAQGYLLGSPAPTGAETGFQWFSQFMGNCSSCSIDFIALHWYGDFSGLASHCGRYYGAFNKSLWITELALPDSDAASTLSMLKTTMQWLDDLAWVDRYSWFGAFRSSQSNVGPNAAFLDATGQLTPVGQAYLGLTSVSTSSSTSTTSLSSTTKSSATSRSSLDLWLLFACIVATVGLRL